MPRLNKPASYKRHACSVCGKQFARRTDLTRHEHIHLGVKPHTCDVCSKTFTQASALKTHKNTHTGEKPHKCGLPGCFSVFSDPSSCSRHRRERHNPNMVHQCPQCNTTRVIPFYDSKSRLTASIRRIKRRSTFKGHLRSRHDLSIDPDACLVLIETPPRRARAASTVKVESPISLPDMPQPELGDALYRLHDEADYFHDNVLYNNNVPQPTYATLAPTNDYFLAPPPSRNYTQTPDLSPASSARSTPTPPIPEPSWVHVVPQQPNHFGPTHGDFGQMKGFVDHAVNQSQYQQHFNYPINPMEPNTMDPHYFHGGQGYIQNPYLWGFDYNTGVVVQ